MEPNPKKSGQLAKRLERCGKPYSLSTCVHASIHMIFPCSNLLAMTYLQQEDFSMVLELLKKAEILTEREPAGKAATYNNLACYYRRQGKLHAALTYLQKALKIESKLPNVQNPADTHINACAVLSQLGKHASALEHAQTALILLQEELLVSENISFTSLHFS